MTDLEKASLDSPVEKLDSSTMTGPSASTSSSFAGLPSTSCSTTTPLQPHQGKRGFRPYITVLGAFLGLFATFGQISSFGVFQTRYKTHELTTVSPSAIAWIGSLQLWCFFFLGWPVGYVFDKYGPRLLLLCGSVLIVLSLLLTSICTKFYQYILCQGFLFGIGAASIFFPSLASVTTHFRTSNRATALGIAIAGSSVGGVVFPIMFERLFTRVGFAWAVRISALISGFCCFVATICVSRSRSKNDVAAAAAVEKGGAQEKKPDCLWWESWRKGVKDLRFVCFALGGCVGSLGLYVPIFYIVSYSKSHSLSSTLSFSTLTILNAGSFFGRILPSILADRLGVFNLIIPSSLLAGVSCLVFWLPFARTEAEIIAFAAVYGFLSGSFVSLINPCVAEISEVREIGSRVGMLYTVVSFSSLVGEPIAGAILASSRHSDDYTGLIVYAGTTVIVGTVLICGTKFTIDRRILAKV